MTAHVTDLAARIASASRRLSFNLLKRQQSVALGESDLSSYLNPDTRHSPKPRHRYSTRSTAKCLKTQEKTNKSDSETSDS
jgi:hypothetical protein